MKSKNILLLVLAMSFSTAYAQSDEQVLNTDPIDVDGYLREKQVTDGELEQIRGEIRKQKNEVVLNKDKAKGYKELSKTTEKLSDVTEEYLDDKKSAQKDIADYNAKIKCLMEENPGKDCSKYVRAQKEVQVVQQDVQTQQSAPMLSAAVHGPKNLEQPFEELKMIPYAGATQYNGDVEQLQTQIAAGLKLEANLTTRFSMGVGLNYAQLKTQDYANSQFGNQQWSGMNNNQYGGNGREIQYSTMGLDFYGKFFITRGERFRPYVGAGLGFNRATLKYSNNDPLMNQGYYGKQFGNENYQNTYATGTIMVGTEVMVTRGFGLLIEAAAGSGFGTSLSSTSAKNLSNSPDQARLKQLGTDVINATAMSVFAGGVVTF